MTVEESIKKAEAKGDIKGLRIMMENSLLVDPTFTEFLEMETLTQSISGLYDSHDGRTFETDKAAWDDDYMNKIMVQVVGNFSHERVAHLKEVVRYLSPTSTTSEGSASYSRKLYEADDSTEQALGISYKERKQQDERNNKIIYNRSTKIATGAVVGGLVGGAAAVVVGWHFVEGAAVGLVGSFVVGAAVGSVAVGVVVAITTNRGQ